MTQLNAIGEGGLNGILTKRLRIHGGPPSPTLEPAVFPTVALEVDRPEWGYLKNEQLYADSVGVVAGGAGTRSSVQLINVRPGSLVVIERITAEAAAAQLKLINYGVNVLPFGTTRVPNARDTRNARVGGVIGKSGALLITDNTLASSAAAAFFSATTLLDYTSPIVLSPGWAVYLAPTADNVALTFTNWVFRERVAEPGELV